MTNWTYGALAAVVLTAGCADVTRGMNDVRNGPQSQSPSTIATPTTVALPQAAPVAPQPVVTTAAQNNACGAAQYQSLVNGPSSAAFALANIPGSSRHYGSQEAVANDTPSRLNFVHSGTAVEAVIDPASTILRIFCG